MRGATSVGRLPGGRSTATKGSLTYSSTAPQHISIGSVARAGSIPVLGEELSPIRYRAAIIEIDVQIAETVKVVVEAQFEIPTPIIDTAVSVDGRELREVNVAIVPQISTLATARVTADVQATAPTVSTVVSKVDMEFVYRNVAVTTSVPTATATRKRRMTDDFSSGTLDATRWPMDRRLGNGMTITNGVAVYNGSTDGVGGMLASVRPLNPSSMFVQGTLQGKMETIQGRAAVLFIRSNMNGSAGVLVYIFSSRAYLFSSSGGQLTQRAVSGAATVSIGHTVGVRAEGSVYTVYRNNAGAITTLVSWDDTSNLVSQSAEEWGVGSARNMFVTGPGWDNVIGGDL